MTSDNSPVNHGPQSNNPSAPGAQRREGAIIGPKTQITGDLQSEEDLLIEGQVTGTLVLRNNQLAIGAQGRVSGTGYANIIVVDGKIEGDLYAVERISIRKGARVQGSIFSPRVSLEDGATLRGAVEMDLKAIQDAIKAKFGDVAKTVEPTAVPKPQLAPSPNSGSPSSSSDQRSSMFPKSAGTDSSKDSHSKDAGSTSSGPAVALVK